jgi:hypothetical protein
VDQFLRSLPGGAAIKEQPSAAGGGVRPPAGGGTPHIAPAGEPVRDPTNGQPQRAADTRQSQQQQQQQPRLQTPEEFFDAADADFLLVVEAAAAAAMRGNAAHGAAPHASGVSSAASRQPHGDPPTAERGSSPARVARAAHAVSTTALSPVGDLRRPAVVASRLSYVLPPAWCGAVAARLGGHFGIGVGPAPPDAPNFLHPQVAAGTTTWRFRPTDPANGVPKVGSATSPTAASAFTPAYYARRPELFTQAFVDASFVRGEVPQQTAAGLAPLGAALLRAYTAAGAANPLEASLLAAAADDARLHALAANIWRTADLILTDDGVAALRDAFRAKRPAPPVVAAPAAAACVRALVAAVYLNFGLEAAMCFIEQHVVSQTMRLVK